MTKDQIIRAWKDEEFRRGLNASELAALPENPAGAVDLTDAELGTVGGGLEEDKSLVCVLVAISEALECIKSIILASCQANTWTCCPK